VIGIDASRNRSGGAIAHLLGILSEINPDSHGIELVHVWAYRSLLDQLPDRPFLVKHNPIALECSLFSQLFWQATRLASEAKGVGCNILFSTDASTLCRFKPMVVLSQDMLSYEPGVMRYFGFGLARLRLLAILAVQNSAFRRASGVIFLTHYAGKIIQNSCGPLSSVAYIPHGVDSQFKEIKLVNEWSTVEKRQIRCVYVSNAEMYKHQWVVIEAVSLLTKRSHKLKLTLIGGGEGAAQKLLENAIATYDSAGTLVEKLDFLPHSSLPEILAQADLFVFASSCENMPVTLVEAMAVGLPIVCSNRGPMPEVLGDGGIYFDPTDAESIADAIENIIQLPELRSAIAGRAKSLSEQYTWRRCADETWRFIEETTKKAQI
jgi:glycosyltransferase involved in cell wall biosynthesis